MLIIQTCYFGIIVANWHIILRNSCHLIETFVVLQWLTKIEVYFWDPRVYKF